jgi:hypothetical protein
MMNRILILLWTLVVGQALQATAFDFVPLRSLQ